MRVEGKIRLLKWQNESGRGKSMNSFKTKVHKINGQYQTDIPNEMVELLNVKEGEEVVVEYHSH